MKPLKNQVTLFWENTFRKTASVLNSIQTRTHGRVILIKPPSVLRFTEIDQEIEFLKHDCESNPRWARFCYASGAILWAAFGFLDMVVAPEEIAQLSMIRYLIGLPVLFLAFLTTLHAPWHSKSKETGLAVTLVCGASIIAMVNILPTTSTHGYFVGLILVLIYAFSFGQLTFRYAVFSGVFLAGFFIAIELFRQRFPFDVIASKSAFLLAAVYIGLFSCGILEHHRRNAFQSQKDMRRANSRLMDLANALQHESTHDELTGLLNRRQLSPLFDVLVERWKAHGESSSIILMDLDNFKRVNDLAGHWTGDKILKEIAELMTKSLHIPHHTFRIGGDEFVIFVPGISSKKCEDFTKMITHLFSEWSSTNLTARVARLGLSIGVAEVNSETDNLEAVLRRADRDLYAAKRRSKTCVSHRVYGSKSGSKR